MTMLMWLKSHWKAAVKGICVASVAFLLLWGINTHNRNIKLSQELEMAQNNIEAYQGLLDSSQQANNVLMLDIKNLKNQNDVTLHKLDSVRDKLKIKPKTVKTAATQTQSIDVIQSKGVGGNIISILKDTIYKDSMNYNDLTTVYYTIGKDSVSIGLKLQNDQYLYVYNTKEYKNKKSFIKRLFTFDFKKITKTKYVIYNTNDLIKTDSVRVVEATK